MNNFANKYKKLRLDKRTNDLYMEKRHIAKFIEMNPYMGQYSKKTETVNGTSSLKGCSQKFHKEKDQIIILKLGLFKSLEKQLTSNKSNILRFNKFQHNFCLIKIIKAISLKPAYVRKHLYFFVLIMC